MCCSRKALCVLFKRVHEGTWVKSKILQNSSHPGCLLSCSRSYWNRSKWCLKTFNSFLFLIRTTVQHPCLLCLAAVIYSCFSFVMLIPFNLPSFSKQETILFFNNGKRYYSSRKRNSISPELWFWFGCLPLLLWVLIVIAGFVTL